MGVAGAVGALEGHRGRQDVEHRGGLRLVNRLPVCPRSVDFDPALPRLTGKLYKRVLEDRYRQPAAGSAPES
jgi:hypothetical protein